VWHAPMHPDHKYLCTLRERLQQYDVVVFEQNLDKWCYYRGNSIECDDHSCKELVSKQSVFSYFLNKFVWSLYKYLPLSISGLFLKFTGNKEFNSMKKKDLQGMTISLDHCTVRYTEDIRMFHTLSAANKKIVQAYKYTMDNLSSADQDMYHDWISRIDADKLINKRDNYMAGILSRIIKNQKYKKIAIVCGDLHVKGISSIVDTFLKSGMSTDTYFQKGFSKY
jgi:hypothetical protein